jgi:hypothetical protein
VFSREEADDDDALPPLLYRSLTDSLADVGHNIKPHHNTINRKKSVVRRVLGRTIFVLKY